MATFPINGQLAGDYLIKKQLGRGDKATVYAGEHRDTGRQVAVKVLLPHLSIQQKVARRFITEARAAASLGHPNIVEVLASGRLEHDVPYYVMELLRGQRLDAALGQQPRLTAAVALPYVKQICAALQAAHDQGIVHRDLKPANVFVLEGEEVRLKLMDFGIARMLEDDDGARLTSPGTVLGSPRWAAPEQVAGQRDAICAQTDIYSLGVLLYWMLSGVPPFSAGEPDLLVEMQIRDTPPPLLERCPELPEAVARLVHQCLEKDPGLRPASAEEVARVFTEAMGASDAYRQRDPSFAQEIAQFKRELAAGKTALKEQIASLQATDADEDARDTPRPPESVAEPVPPAGPEEPAGQTGADEPGRRHLSDLLPRTEDFVVTKDHPPDGPGELVPGPRIDEGKTDILSLDQLVPGHAPDDPGEEARGTVIALPLLGDEPVDDRTTEKALPLLGEMPEGPGEDEDNLEARITVPYNSLLEPGDSGGEDP